MFATIYLPNFYLQAATRHQPELREKPMALIEEQERKPVIIQLNEAAEKAGIRKGMTPSQALARSNRSRKSYFTTRLLSVPLSKALRPVFAPFNLPTTAI